MIIYSYPVAEHMKKTQITHILAFRSFIISTEWKLRSDYHRTAVNSEFFLSQDANMVIDQVCTY